MFWCFMRERFAKLFGIYHETITPEELERDRLADLTLPRLYESVKKQGVRFGLYPIGGVILDFFTSKSIIVRVDESNLYTPNKQCLVMVLPHLLGSAMSIMDYRGEEKISARQK